MKISTSIFALSLGIFASQANAADVFSGRDSMKDGTDVPFQEKATRSWTGLWIGAMGGYQFGNSALTFDAKEVQGNEGSETVPLGGVEKSEHFGIDGLGSDGFFGEGQIGFDKQIGRRLVVGVFGGYNLNNAEFSVDASSFNAWSDPQSESANIVSFEQEWGAVVGLRAGVLASPNTLIYVAGGWAFGEIGNVQSDFGGDDGKGGNVFEKQETDLSGFFGEVGLETRLTDLGDNVYFTLAGRYTDFNAITLASESGNCDEGDTCSGSIKLDPDLLAVMAGLKFKLGGNVPYLGD